MQAHADGDNKRAEPESGSAAPVAELKNTVRITGLQTLCRATVRAICTG